VSATGASGVGDFTRSVALEGLYGWPIVQVPTRRSARGGLSVRVASAALYGRKHSNPSRESGVGVAASVVDQRVTSQRLPPGRRGIRFGGCSARQVSAWMSWRGATYELRVP